MQADEHGRVVVIHGEDDKFAQDRLVSGMLGALGERGVVECVDRSASLRALLERHVATELFVAAVVCASDPATAATLIWDLAEPRSHAMFGSRVLVLLGTMSRLRALPERLLEAFEFIGMDELGEDEAVAAVLDRVDRLDRAPRPVDVLASVYRSAVARRSPDGLLAIHAAVGRSFEIDPRELAVVARVGDRGRRPNPLWSRWISHGRTLTLAEPSRNKALSKQRKQ